MKKLVIFLLLICSQLPAQGLYSYMGKDGRLVITDRPIKKEGFKLVEIYKRKEKENTTFEESKPQYDPSDDSIDESEIIGSRGAAKRLNNEQIEGLMFPIAKTMGIDPDLVRAVIMVESGKNIRALSNKGAVGLMQLMPATAKRFGVNNIWDPRENIKGGITYLRYLISYFQGDLDLVIAAYNAGENAVDKYKGIPPYKETQNYVRKIRRIYTEKSHPYDNTAPRPSILVTSNDEPVTTKQIARAE